MLAVFSDLHKNYLNLEKFLNYLKEQNIKIAIGCGDTEEKELLEKILQDNIKLFYALGNADYFSKNDLAENNNLEIGKDFLKIKIGSLKIACTHYPQEAQKLALNNQLDFVFFGHTHKPEIKKINSTVLLNPGTLGGIYYQPSFALVDEKTKKFELKLLNQI